MLAERKEEDGGWRALEKECEGYHFLAYHLRSDFDQTGWIVTGDSLVNQLFSETACYNMYMPAFYRKYLWDMRAEQSLIDGAVPNVVPGSKKA